MKKDLSDFTLKRYRHILKEAKKKYVLRTFNNYVDKERFLIIRHDVDCSLHRAKKMAFLEKEEGIVSTYFIHLHNEFYNLLERAVSDCVLEIMRAGHAIGLHFDCEYYGIIREDELKKYLSLEKKLLEDIFRTKISVFSFHNPTQATAVFSSESYSGMINTYSDFFRLKVAYCSDSNGYWRFGNCLEVLKKSHARLQILIHPNWWQEKYMQPRKRIIRAIEGRARKTLKNYDALLLKHGRRNI